MKLNAMAGLGAAALIISGCGSSTSITVSDDQLIRATLIQEVGAASAWDFDAVAEVTCEKYREHARTQADRLIPPMSTFDEVEPAALGPDLLSTILKGKIPNSSTEQTDAVARALIDRNQAAYTDAMATLIRQTSKSRLGRQRMNRDATTVRRASSIVHVCLTLTERYLLALVVSLLHHEDQSE